MSHSKPRENKILGGKSRANCWDIPEICCAQKLENKMFRVFNLCPLLMLVRTKCSQRSVSLKKSPLKVALIFKHAKE